MIMIIIMIIIEKINCGKRIKQLLFSFLSFLFSLKGGFVLIIMIIIIIMIVIIMPIIIIIIIHS